jgi:hypothetical protein
MCEASNRHSHTWSKQTPMKITFAIVCLLWLSAHALAQDEPYVAPTPEQRALQYAKEDAEEAKISDHEWFIRHKAAHPLAARAVRVFFTQNAVTGDTIPAIALLQILFTEEPCTLDLADAGSMHRAWTRSSAYQLGCWFPVQGDKWVFVGQLEGMTSENNSAWATFPRALLHADGSATITEPNYDSRTFTFNFLSKRLTHMNDHLHDQP